MINYFVFITILIILFFVSTIAIKAMRRGIKAKKNLNKEYIKSRNKKKK